MDRHKQVEATMRKFAATVLALALATTHGLLDEGGPIVQKDAPKGLRGDAQADSSPRAAVGRKLEFGYFKTKTNQPTAEPTAEPTAAPKPCPARPSKGVSPEASAAAT